MGNYPLLGLALILLVPSWPQLSTQASPRTGAPALPLSTSDRLLTRSQSPVFENQIKTVTPPAKLSDPFTDAAAWTDPLEDPGFKSTVRAVDTLQAVPASTSTATGPVVKLGQSSTATSGALPLATLQSYQIEDKKVSTVYLRDLPIISFTESPATVDPFTRASTLVAELNQSLQHPEEQTVTIVAGSERSSDHYVIKLNDQPLVNIDQGVLLTSPHQTYEKIALLARNRLQRLLLKSPTFPLPPTQEIQLESEPVQLQAQVPTPFQQEGIASWYHAKPEDEPLTASHLTLPIGTRVQITNLDNGAQTIATITDRGPFLKGRIIDVSLSTATALNMVNAGIARVRIKVITQP